MSDPTNSDTGNLESLRAEVRGWLAANAPKGWREAYKLMSHAEFAQAQRDWFQTLVKAGYAVPHWPAQWPGGGRSLAEQKVLYEELASADCPRLLLSFVSTYHAAATIMECGSEAQKARYLPAILEGETWCQGFSEPGAGSDLASLKCKAERVSRPGGDVYVINGQKVWSTMAQYADKCMLLVRTASDGPKQAGITFLLMDMKAKGVSVRPISQIQGDEEYCEIFLDDVEVPVSDRIGEEHAGWAVTSATLSAERGLTLMELTYRMRGALSRIAALIREKGRDEDRGILRDFGQLVARCDTACAIADRFLENRMQDIERVGDASIVKNTYSRVLREYSLLGLRLGGMDEQYRAPITYGDLNTGNWMADFMNSYAWTIAAGSEEVQRNIISERMLEMQREPKGWDGMIELSELRDAAQKAFPADKLASPRDAAWQLVAEQGWLMISLPEDQGGLGLGRDAAVAIHFELGRVLSTAPLIPALMALEGIAASTVLADREGWIERICGGDYVPLNMLPGGVDDSGGTLSGRLCGFFEADMAGHVLAGMAGKYLLIPTDAPGVTLHKRALWDESRNLFDIELTGYAPDPALLVASGDESKLVHDRISPLAQLAIAADSLGGANAALEMTVEYLKTRRQFDRPIAMFQALKHRCADLKTRIAAAEALLWQRAANLDASITDLGVTKALANDCYLETTEEAIQMHGGIGLTEEHNCHLFMKRAMLNAQLSGSGDHWREAAGRQALAQYA